MACGSLHTAEKQWKSRAETKLVWFMPRCILFCGNRKTKKTFPNITITIDRTGGFLAKAGFFFYLVRALQRRRCRWRQTMEACLQSDADRCNNGDDGRYQNKRVFLVFFDTPNTGKYWWAKKYFTFSENPEKDPFLPMCLQIPLRNSFIISDVIIQSFQVTS